MPQDAQPHDRSTRPHLVPLGNGAWSLWRWVWLRGAGFPARRILELGSNAVVAQLGGEEMAQDRLERAHRAAMDACVAATSANTAAGQAIKHARGRLLAGRLPSRPTGNAGVDAAIEAYRAARTELAASRERTIEIVKAARTQAAEALQRIGRDPRFREALTWQNRSVLGNAVDRLLDTAPETDDYKTRERQRLVAKYAQRYLLKNDSIGFFGPIAWGSFDHTSDGFTVRPGASFLDIRRVAFEDWAMEALAAQLSRDAALRPIFRPRRRPSAWLDGDMLHNPPGPPRRATPCEVAFLAAADGTKTARELAEASVADPRSGLASIDDAYAELERLARENLITWGIELPAELEHPERWLREALARVEDPAVRASALDYLDRMEAARAEVAAAAGDPVALDARIVKLEEEFRQITELSEKRGHGRTYVGRQIFFEDCRRAIDLRVGRTFLASLDPPLSLILSSARWFTYEIARRYRRAFHDTYWQLRGASSSCVPLMTFLAASRGLFSGSQYQKAPFVDEVQAELQRRWAEILGIDRATPDTRAVQLASAGCQPRVDELFRAPGPGWPRARYHCPDLMIAAASVDEIDKGNYLGVLGEVHPGVNTLLAHVAFRLHPDRAAFCEAYDADMEMVCIAPIQTGVNRAMNSPLSPRHHHVEFGAVRSWRPRTQVHFAGDLYVEGVGDRLHVRSRACDIDYDIIAFMDQYLGAEGMSHFKLLPRRPHTPRITVDKLVISRERWHLEPADFRGLTEEATEAERVKRVNAWTRHLGVPRYVFATVPHEPKPIYVDFSSPIYIDNFVRLLPKATTLGLSEMLPGHDDLWLPDADGNLYTCELRLAAVDPEPWSPRAASEASMSVQPSASRGDRNGAPGPCPGAPEERG
jgi:hypothetical protein